MLKKWIAVFIVFFLGTGGLITVDQVCRERTGLGGQAGLSLHKAADGGVEFCFFGLEGKAGR